MKENEVIWKRQKFNTRFKNEDMDFMFNWAVGVTQIIGMSASQIYMAVHGIKDGDSKGWREGFRRQGDFQLEHAKVFLENKQNLAAGQNYFGATYAYRASLQYTDPADNEFKKLIQKMEESFQKGSNLIGIPMRPIEVPFEDTTLPGYFLEQDKKQRPVVIMIGGSDSFREDLFYFAGYPGWKRGYNVVMIDLPGQGILPNRGQHFRIDMNKPITAVLDWLEINATVKPEQIAIYGVSGGGYFTAQGVASDSRINAWIGSTPIFDIAEVFRKEVGNALKAPGWLINTFMRIAGSLNESAAINLNKYAWQFGTADFKSAVDQVFKQALTVDYTKIKCPSLFLMSEGEGDELKRQTLEIFNAFKKRGQNVTIREFTAAEGADGHCQLNNLRLAHIVVFDWLDQIFGNKETDIRLKC
jgi:pimeloyl-ACP methyl ester carboxylesterase